MGLLYVGTCGVRVCNILPDVINGAVLSKKECENWTYISSAVDGKGFIVCLITLLRGSEGTQFMH